MEAMGLTEYIVETRGVGKNYGSTVALKDVSIHIKRGEIYGLVGDNGAGKSTMLKLLAGHIYPTEGEVALFGKTGEKELERCRPQIGFMIEHPGFFPYLSMEKNLEYCRLLKGVPGSEKNEEIGIQKLREKCQDYPEITVSDPQTYLAMLSEIFGKENYRVYPGEVIRIFNPQKSAEEYSKLALQYGLVVTGLRRQQTSLEDYYMDLKGGNQR